MTPSFEDIVRSPQFTFLVGTEKTPIVVHAAAIATTSKPMDALINGPMSESQTKSAVMEDVQVEDFVRFCEYAYRGDFTVPAPVEEFMAEEFIPGLPQTINEEVEPALEVPSGFGTQVNFNVPRKKKGSAPAAPVDVSAGRKPSLRDKIKDRVYLGDGDSKTEILTQFIPKTNAVNQDFAPVFLAYARLYTFANMQLVEPLKTLILHKLRQTLLIFQVHIERVTNIIKLVRYAYNSDHTPDRKRDGTIDELRKLVVEYVAYEINTIGNCVEFAELLEEGGEFVRDFWGIAMEHLI